MRLWGLNENVGIKLTYLYLTRTVSERKCWLLRCVRLFATPWPVAHQAPLFMEFSRQEFWSRSPFHSPGDLPHPGIETGSPALQADALPSESLGKPSTRVE